MSVKKTGTGYTITEEQKNKADKQILARMEAGKGEIMKLVEGVPGSEKLTELIERGKLIHSDTIGAYNDLIWQGIRWRD